MRSLTLAAITMVTAFGASGADAQRIATYPGAAYPVPGQVMQQQLPPVTQGGQTRTQSRWGGTVGGRWYGGVNAPGGWSAYRRPSRGHRLPSYWTGASFFIGDFAGYGLSAPPQGYRWYRYYDDAVLVDDRGQVYDSVGGLDWNGGGYGGAGGYASDGYAYAQGGAGGAGGGYSQQYQQQGGYPQQYQQTYAQPLPPVQQNGGVTTYSTSSDYATQDSYAQGGYPQGGHPQPRGGYTANGYYYPPETTTVVTVQSAPTVTTTTEYIEETTTGTRYRTRYVAPRRVYRPAPRRVYRPAVRPCGCAPARVVVRTRVIHVPVRKRVRTHAPVVEETIQGS